MKESSQLRLVEASRELKTQVSLHTGQVAPYLSLRPKGRILRSKAIGRDITTLGVGLFPR